MVIKGTQTGEVIEVNDGWTDTTVKTLIRCVKDDAERYAKHEALKAAKDYAPPVFPNEPLSYQGRSR